MPILPVVSVGPSLPLTSAWGSWFHTKALGAALVIAVAATVLGYVISKLWPKTFNPGLFGFLAAIAFVGGLAMADVPGAGLAIVLCLAVAVLTLALGVTGLG